MAETPFRIGSHVSGEYFTDRATELKRILRAMREPTRLLVFGPRRMGKSSAIAVAADRARREGGLVVRADLSTASTLVDVASRLLRSLSGQRKREWLAELASNLAPSISITFDPVTGAPQLVLGAERRSQSDAAQRRSLEEVVGAVAGAASDGGVVIVLDEFQAVRRFGGEAAEWHLRDLMQTHGDISFVCAGSEVSLVEEMLAKERAFFRTFELLHLGPIPDEHFARWIDSRFEGGGVAADGVGAALVERIGPRTQDVLQVARHVHVRARSTGRATPDDVEPAVQDVVREEDPVIRTLWGALTTHQQNVLRAVASSEDELFSAAVRDRFGLPTSSTVASAVDALERKGILTRVGEDRSIVFDNPFVHAWVESEALPDVPWIS